MQITPIQLPGSLCTVYICGPPSFETHIRSLLLVAKVPEQAIHSESFLIQSLAPQTPYKTPVGATIRFTRSKKEILWDGTTSSILEGAEGAGLKPEFGCRVGAYGSCEMRLIKGSVRLWGKKDSCEEETKVVRICSAVPASSLIEFEF